MSAKRKKGGGGSENSLIEWLLMPKQKVDVDRLQTKNAIIVYEACKNQRCVDIEYFGDGKPKTSRRIEPFELFKRGNDVYVYAYCHLRHDMRHFRIDRIYKAIPTEDPCRHIDRKPVIYKLKTEASHSIEESPEGSHSSFSKLLFYIAIFLLLLLFAYNGL